MTESVDGVDGVGAPSRARPKRLKLGVWRQALVSIPRVTAGEWQDLDIVSRWLIASRAAVLVITFVPCLIAGLLALRDRVFDGLLWLLVTVGLLLAHATNNLLNDLTDFLKGVDRGNYFRARYGPQPLEHGLLSTRQVLVYALGTGAMALAIGGYLVSIRGGVTLELLAAGAFFVLFYTWPLKYVGLGEVAVVLVWGPLMIGGAYFVVSGIWDWEVALFSLVYAGGATSVLFGKHIDKLEEDRERGIRTLPVLLGERRARWTAGGLMIAPYLLVVVFVARGFVTPALLLVFLALPSLRRALVVFRRPRPAAPPDGYPAAAWPLWFVSFAFVHNRAFGSWLVLGLLVDVAWVRMLA